MNNNDLAVLGLILIFVSLFFGGWFTLLLGVLLCVFASVRNSKF
jgi:uncharacterized membrane protein